MHKLIFTTFLSFALFGCDDSTKQAKPTGQPSSKEEKAKNNNKPEGAGQNTTSPGY